MKQRAKALGLDDIRVNNAGCLERCELGPAMVIYPEGIWYHYDSEADIDEILESHVLNGKPVDRLQLKDGDKFPEHAGFDRLNLNVAAIDSVGADLVRIELRNSKGGNLPKFDAGAHLDLLIDRDRLRRSYSLTNHPVERERYVIHVLNREKHSGASEWLHTTLKPGDVIQARLPENVLAIDESATRHFLVGEGIGIAPFLSMSARLRDIGAEFYVYYLADSRSNAPFERTLQEICAQNLETHYSSERFKANRLTDSFRKYAAGDHLYLCGSRDMVSNIQGALPDWPTECIHTEHFFPDHGARLNPQAFNVTLARRQKTLRVSDQKTILDALRDADIPIDYACEEGLCGACRVGVLYGEVEHRDSVLTGAEKSANTTMMACISRAAKGQTRLILDI